MNWFLYDNGLSHERVKGYYIFQITNDLRSYAINPFSTNVRLV